MDPITQGLLGATAAQAVTGKRIPRWSLLIGGLAGMAPDLDVFIAGSNEVLGEMLYHRGFTHSLVFIPVGAFLCALPFLPIRRLRNHRSDVLLASLVGFATHAPLDALTSYGTQLFWPMSNIRVSLDFLPIIDFFIWPLLLIGAVAGLLLRQWKCSAAAVAIFLAYVMFGAWQHHRVLTIQRELAEVRGDTWEHRRAMPSPGTLLLWRAIYRTPDGDLQADGVRVPYFGRAQVHPGARTELVRFEDLPVPQREEWRRPYEVFSWFADGFVSPAGNEGNRVGDWRYGLPPHGGRTMWGMEFRPDGSVASTGRSDQEEGQEESRVKALSRLTFRGDPSYLPMEEALGRAKNSASKESSAPHSGPNLSL